MRIIDKLEVYRLADQTCLASSTYFWARRRWFPRCTTCSLGTWPRLLDHTASFLRLEVFVLCLKDPQRFNARLTIGKYGQLHGTLSLIMAFTCRPSPYWLFSFFCISSSPFSSVALTVAVLLKYLWNCWIEVRSVSDLQAIDGKEDLLCIWLKQESAWRCKGSRRRHRDSLRLWNWRQERT